MMMKKKEEKGEEEKSVSRKTWRGPKSCFQREEMQSEDEKQLREQQEMQRMLQEQRQMQQILQEQEQMQRMQQEANMAKVYMSLHSLPFRVTDS